MFSHRGWGITKTHTWWASPPPDGTWKKPASRSPITKGQRGWPWVIAKKKQTNGHKLLSGNLYYSVPFLDTSLDCCATLGDKKINSHMNIEIVQNGNNFNQWSFFGVERVVSESPGLTGSDILHKLDSFSTYCEAKTELVLLYHHAPLDQTRTCKKRRVNYEIRSVDFDSIKTSVTITCTLHWDIKCWLSLLGGRSFALWVPNGQTAEPSGRAMKQKFKD